ncbi:MAG: S-layer homology domain-containing protein [Clostridiales bacterium]|nr:S-layer homology domain-containing protein [Clostridiales bacterium]
MKMKRFAVLILSGLFMVSLVGLAWAVADFTDVAGLNAQEMAAIEKLHSLGVVQGYPDGTFRPQQAVTRAEMAKIMCAYSGADELLADRSAFSDVAAKDWYYAWVNRAADNNWVNGYADGAYKPQESVTQQEALAMLLRMQDVETSHFIWPADYIQYGQELDMFAGFNFNASAQASRLIICRMIYNLAEDKDEARVGNEKGLENSKDSGDSDDDVDEDNDSSKADSASTSGQTLADGMYIGMVKETAEREFSFWHMEKPLSIASGLRRTPKADTMIYCMVKEGAVESWSLLLDVGQENIFTAADLTRKQVKNGPYAWVATRTGKAVTSTVNLEAAKPLVRFLSYRNISVGPNSQENRNYWLGDDCLFYEAKDATVTEGSRDSIELGQAVTLLVNEEDEVVLLICWK